MRPVTRVAEHTPQHGGGDLALEEVISGAGLHRRALHAAIALCAAIHLGSVVFRPIAYLTVPTTPRIVLDEDLLEKEVSQTDNNVYSQVRVHWANDSYYPKQDGFYAAPPGLAALLGARVYTVNAPWITTSDGANFLAKSLLQQFAAGVSVGTLSKVADPAFRIGTVIQVPSLADAGSYGYFYLQGKTYTLEVGQAFSETLTVAFGRNPGLSFPYVGTLDVPVLTTGAAQGIPQGSGGASINAFGQIVTPLARPA